jgi:hypothetical protein
VSRGPTPSWRERLRSMRNDLSLRISSRVRFSRGVFTESPCGRLQNLTADQARRIDLLRAKYSVRFETLLSQETSLNNYAYLELMDRAWARAQSDPPWGGEQSDVGCASFWYASAVHAFFRPDSLTGYEIDAFRRYLDGYSRQDFARGYAAAWPNTRFRGLDYLAVQEKVDRISCWFPFVSNHSILAWGLPLNLLNPETLFVHIAGNLKKGGFLFMVNHGPAEARTAADLCKAAGLVRQWQWLDSEPLRPRPEPPTLSYWRH